MTLNQCLKPPKRSGAFLFYEFQLSYIYIVADGFVKLLIEKLVGEINVGSVEHLLHNRLVQVHINIIVPYIIECVFYLLQLCRGWFYLKAVANIGRHIHD